jgi:hypothetical protein
MNTIPIIFSYVVLYMQLVFSNRGTGGEFINTYKLQSFPYLLGDLNIGLLHIYNFQRAFPLSTDACHHTPYTRSWSPSKMGVEYDNTG